MNKSPTAIFPNGAFTLIRANTGAAIYNGINIEDHQGNHFRLVIRNSEGMMFWRDWIFESDTGYWLNKFIESDGVPLQSPANSI